MKNCPVCYRTYEDDETTCLQDGAALVEEAPEQDRYITQTIKGRYHVIRKLGEGGMGSLYLAEQVNIRKKVALKILTSQFARDPEFVKRFQREARLAASLNHRNIVSVSDFDQVEDGSLFIAMEYVDGKSLSEVIQQEGPLDIRKAVRFGIQIAEGLNAAHQLGVIHRDVKPQNIMVVGDGETIKLMDFGIARSMNTTSSIRLTRPNVIMGTPEYMAPEQVDGLEASEQTDIYSFGIVLYNMLSGSVPFTASTPGAILIKHLREIPTPLRRLRKEVPSSLERIVMQALEKKPERRQRNVGEIVDALKEAATMLEEKTMAKTLWVSRPRQVTAWRSSPMQWKIAAGAIILLVVGGAYWFLKTRQTPEAPPPVASVPASLATADENKKIVEQQLAEEEKRQAALRQEANDELARRRAEEAERKRVEAKQREAAELAKKVEESQQAKLTKEKAERELASRQAERNRIQKQAEVERSAKEQERLKQAEADRVAREREQEKLKQAELERAAKAQEKAKQAESKLPEALAKRPTLSEADRTRISNLLEQKLRNQGLLKVSDSDRWGVGFEINPNGIVTLSGMLRDQRLRAEAMRLAGEVPGVAEVRQKVQVAEAAKVDQTALEMRSQIEQKLKSRGLLKSSESDRWGVMVDAAADGTVTLKGSLRDQRMRAEAVRLAREVPGVGDVRQAITVPETDESR